MTLELILQILARLAGIAEAWVKGDDVSPEDLAFAHTMAQAAEDAILNTAPTVEED